MRCEQVRELLPDHLLGSLDEVAEAGVRRHLRGCASCREEQDRLEEGIAALSRAAHDEEPPEALRERVLTELAEEWKEVGPAPAAPEPARASSVTARSGVGRGRALGAAAAALLLVVSLAWGLSEHRRASLAAADAASYHAVLSTLGGKDFRLGTLQAANGWGGLQGQVILYDGDTTGGWTSWGLVFLQDPGRAGTLTATLLSAGGRTRVLPPLRFASGQASAWIASAGDLRSFDRLTVTDASGAVLATARIHPA